MRRALINEALEYCLKNPPKVDLAVPIPFDLTADEDEELDRLLLIESNKLTSWPEPVIM